jgi:membrane fusion protein (multidrug efflux system)
MKVAWVIIVILAVGATVFVGPLSYSIVRNTEGLLSTVTLARMVLFPARETPPAETPSVNIETEVVAAQPELADEFSLPAVVEANRVVDVSAEVSGRIERIHGREGAAYRAGDRLIDLNTDLLKAEYESAAANARHAAIRYRRISNLHKEGSVTDRDLDQAEADLAVANAAADAARARLDRAVIVAPINGVLNRVPVEEGEYVGEGAPVAQMVEIDTVKVVIQVPEREVQYFKTESDARAASITDPPPTARVMATIRGREISLEGTITYIAQLADPQTRSTRMEITLDNRERLLRSGQIVRAWLTRRVLRDVIMVPLAAVIPQEEGQAVYIVNDGKAERRDVRLGLIKGRAVRILSGLKPGDSLVVAGHRFVAPGQPVKVIGRTPVGPRSSSQPPVSPP